jgi:hypothetical protein
MLIPLAVLKLALRTVNSQWALVATMLIPLAVLKQFDKTAITAFKIEVATMLIPLAVLKLKQKLRNQLEYCCNYAHTACGIETRSPFKLAIVKLCTVATMLIPLAVLKRQRLLNVQNLHLKLQLCSYRLRY